MIAVVVPGYYLVCYNCCSFSMRCICVVVPGYYLVCYNSFCCIPGISQL